MTADKLWKYAEYGSFETHALHVISSSSSSFSSSSAFPAISLGFTIFGEFFA